MKNATSATVFRDAVGMRMSVTYSEVDDTTGEIISDNNRITKVLVDHDNVSKAEAIVQVAQSFIDSL